MKWGKVVTLLFLFHFTASCGPNKSSQTIYQKKGYYQQDFVSPVALFIRERNDSPYIIASAFLVDRQRGLFASAKHFIGSESDGDCKIFFNGKVYPGFLIMVPIITDLAIIKIKGDYNSKNFPEPYRLASEVNNGDKIFVRGIHPHPKRYRDGKKTIPIFSKYYGIIGKDEEFVFDDLAGEIVDTAKIEKNSEIKGMPEILLQVSNIYLTIKTDKDHRFQFSGLSGGPTVNAKNEIVGINSWQEPAFLEINENGAVYHPWVTLNLVPVEELAKLMLQLKNIY